MMVTLRPEATRTGLPLAVAVGSSPEPPPSPLEYPPSEEPATLLPRLLRRERVRIPLSSQALRPLVDGGGAADRGAG